MKKMLTMLVVLGLTISLTNADEKEVNIPEICINEIAWAGTMASSFDEWIELKNNSDEPIELSGWILSWREDAENPVVIAFPRPEEGKEAEVIPAKGFYLLERSNDQTINDIEADFIYTGGLGNSGEILVLKNAEGKIVDLVGSKGEKWAAGTASDGDVPYASMERVDFSASNPESNWSTNDGKTINGKDAKGNPINGTPGAKNSGSM